MNFELEYTIGSRQYELSNHLGNVLAVISDWKVPVISGASVVSYTTVVVSSQDYSPFGVTLSGRSWSAGYRYGFNGMEKDNETFSGAYDFGARIMDVRLGRWMSVDKFVRLYNSNSGYCFALNSVITNTDVDGNVVQGDVNQFISDISAILCKIDGADIFVGLLEAQADINQVAQISEADFQTALAGLKDNPDAQALINGIYQIINSTMIYQIEYVNDKDNLALLVEEEESTFREDLLGKTGFDLRNGIANNYDKAQKEENSTGIIGKVVDISESVKKYYCIIHEDAVSTEFYFPSIGGDSKTIQAIPAYSMLNMLMTGFFKIDPFIRNQKGQDTQKPGYVVENLARGLTNEPLISNNGTALFYKIPWELEVDFKNKQSKKAKNKNKSNNDKRRNQPKGNKSSRHANPRFL
jgi:RHS repeat-associated protein